MVSNLQKTPTIWHRRFTVCSTSHRIDLCFAQFSLRHINMLWQWELSCLHPNYFPCAILHQHLLFQKVCDMSQSCCEGIHSTLVIEPFHVIRASTHVEIHFPGGVGRGIRICRQMFVFWFSVVISFHYETCGFARKAVCPPPLLFRQILLQLYLRFCRIAWCVHTDLMGREENRDRREWGNEETEGWRGESDSRSSGGK
jgi:hypothetical protein